MFSLWNVILTMASTTNCTIHKLNMNNYNDVQYVESTSKVAGMIMRVFYKLNMDNRGVQQTTQCKLKLQIM